MNIVLGGLLGASVSAIGAGYFTGVAYYGDPDAVKAGSAFGGLLGYVVGTFIALGVSALK